MKCRALYKTNSNYNLVFFKSKGVKLPVKILISLSSTNASASSSEELILIAFNDNFPTSITSVSKTFQKNDDIVFSCKVNINREDLFASKIEEAKFTWPSSSSTLEQTYNCTISIENEINKTVKDTNKNVIKNKKYKKLVVQSFELVKNDGILEVEISDIPFKDFCCAIKADDNYAYQQEGVAYGLIQRMSIIKGELWYQINHGLPLLDKVRNKQIFDSVLINIILNHPDVKNIEYFNSYIDKHTYKYSCRVLTIYNASIDIENTI